MHTKSFTMQVEGSGRKYLSSGFRSVEEAVSELTSSPDRVQATVYNEKGKKVLTISGHVFKKDDKEHEVVLETGPHRYETFKFPCVELLFWFLRDRGYDAPAFVKLGDGSAGFSLRKKIAYCFKEEKPCA